MAPPRLAEATLHRLRADIARPAYDRRAAAAGVVHLGIGAFHRAHQAAIFDRLLETDPRWAVRAASLRSGSVRDVMAPQDSLYCLVERAGEGERIRLLGAVRDVLVAPQDPLALVEALAARETHIVTVTVTEKGYLPDPQETAGQPRTAAGFLAVALALRRERGLAPFTVISCDNLPHNGVRLRQAVLDRAEPHLRDWIAERAAFPQTMVDRIVPATDDADVERLAARIGLVDRAMVKTEPFLQWVIEDRFAGERPDFEAAGVQVVADVAPWEEAKLRLLNGAHSAIAYLGGLAGIAFVHDFVANPAGRDFVEALWDEAETTLSPPPGLDLAAYRGALMARFANAALQHRTRQIAMDGSQKLPQRLLGPIAVRLERGRPINALALAVAAWMRWQHGRTDAGDAFAVDDPLAAETRRRLAGAAGAAAQVRALLAMDAIFPPPLAADPRFEAALVRQLDWLLASGARAAVERFAAGEGGRHG
jgi:fructuronate reductase